jgi:hypothetical protein
LDQSGIPPSGGIPLALLDLTGLTVLSLWSTQLVGSIPSSIGQLTRLWGLELGFSKLTGSIPSAVGKLTDLASLDVAYNQLGGSLPSTIGQLTRLYNINLVGNQLTGSIPSSIGLLTRLSYLGLNDNQLTGSVPQEMLQLKNLTFLRLDANPKLTGLLPAFDFTQFTTCCAIGGDAFACPLPAGANTTCIGGPTARSCGGGNSKYAPPTCIMGPLLPCDGSSSNLTANDCNAWQRFSRDPLYKEWAQIKCGAKVHTDPCSCTLGGGGALKVGCANGRITYLRTYDGLPGSGSLPLSLLDLTGLTHFDLTYSRLTGSIPSTIAKLSGLVYLDLNKNQFTGSVPTELAGLKQLTTLGLQHNPHLTGLLPAFDFANITSCCRMDADVFTCPLPAHANKCVGGPACGGAKVYPPPTCKDISTWAELNVAVAAVAGKTAALTLSPSFTMEGYVSYSAWSSIEDAAGKTTTLMHTWPGISIDTAYTSVSIFGNGATFDANGAPHHPGRFFTVGEKAVLTMSNATLRNGYIWPDPGAYGGAVYVASGGTFIVTSSTFSGNTVSSTSRTLGGAVYVASGGTFTVTSTVFSGNQAIGSESAGGALFVDGGTVLIKNCSFVGPISNQHNDISKKGGNVTFACADGEIGTPVQMQATEITVIPPKELQCK